jgi:hypothetical protein
MPIQRLLLAAGLAAGACACQVTPNPNSNTPPTITVTLIDKLQNQGWANNQMVLANGGLVTVDPNIDVLVAVSAHDPAGMNTLNGTVQFYVNACGFSQGGGVFDPLDSVNATATHNPPNTVTDTIPYLYEVKTATLKAQPCNFGQNGSSGLGTVVVRMTATNQANLQTAYSGDIHTVGGVIPQ